VDDTVTAPDRPVAARRARALAFVTLVLLIVIPIVLSSQIGA
jgi:hypothetical protein